LGLFAPRPSIEKGAFGPKERDMSAEARRQTKIAIIGDRFMTPSTFEAAIRARCGGALDIETMQLPWPDEPMRHGYVEPGMDGLKEYQGDAVKIAAFVGSAEIAITQLAPFSAAMLKRMPALKLIAVARGGPVNIDCAAARERGVTIVNAPGRNASAVAEFTIGAIIAETRLMTRGHDALRRGEWRGDLYRADLVGREVSQMTIGVIGYGHVGTRVVRLLKAFGGRILVTDPYAELSPEDARDGVVQTTLAALLRDSDVVTLHARVTAETLGFIGRAEFAAMRKGAVFVNTARGPMVDYDALTEALKSSHLRGAMLETFAVEPAAAGLELLTLENVTLTPHIAGASLKTIERAAGAAAEEVRRYLAGEAPLNPCG
jgi:D-3-phosphoglycerate dehydrogenase / 2-oxoglutarate reductase